MSEAVGEFLEAVYIIFANPRFMIKEAFKILICIVALYRETSHHLSEPFQEKLHPPGILPLEFRSHSEYWLGPRTPHPEEAHHRPLPV